MSRTSHQIESKQLSSNTSVSVRASHKGARLDQPLWGVHWFNARNALLSSLYNIFLFPIFQQVGAEVLFKGHFIKKIEGKADYDRHNLQIECYPNATSFLELASLGIYKTLYPLFKLANREVVFGFSKRLDNGSKPSHKARKYWGSEHYLIHIYQADRAFVLSKQFALSEVAYKHGVRLYFSGSTEALMTRTHRNNQIHYPFFMDGILVFEGTSETALMDMKNDEKYKQFQEKTSRSSLYFFKREI